MKKIYKYLFSVMILVTLSFGCSCKSHVTSGNVMIISSVDGNELKSVTGNQKTLSANWAL